MSEEMRASADRIADIVGNVAEVVSFGKLLETFQVGPSEAIATIHEQRIKAFLVVDGIMFFGGEDVARVGEAIRRRRAKMAAADATPARAVEEN